MTRRRLTLVGIGLGHPDHLTLEAVHALQSASVALVTVKRTGDPLAAVRRDLLAHHAPRLRVVEVVDPERDRSAASTSTTSGYEGVVGDWHEARAQAWEQALLEHPDGDVVVLVWGDPAFYDSTIRVVERVLARSAVAVDWSVLPGISALQLLAARHRVVLHEVGQPVHVTTERRLREAVEQGQRNVGAARRGPGGRRGRRDRGSACGRKGRGRLGDGPLPPAPPHLNPPHPADREMVGTCSRTTAASPSSVSWS